MLTNVIKKNDLKPKLKHTAKSKPNSRLGSVGIFMEEPAQVYLVPKLFSYIGHLLGVALHVCNDHLYFVFET